MVYEIVKTVKPSDVYKGEEPKKKIESLLRATGARIVAFRPYEVGDKIIDTVGLKNEVYDKDVVNVHFKGDSKIPESCRFILSVPQPQEDYWE